MIKVNESIQKFNRYFSSPKDVILFLKIFYVITVLPLLLKLMSFSAIMRKFTPLAGKLTEHSEVEQCIEKIRAYTDFIYGLNVWIYKSSCLKRTLILCYFLRKYGVEVRLCIGTRRGESEELITQNTRQFQAHAWLMYKGDFFLEKNHEQTRSYKIINCFP